MCLLLTMVLTVQVFSARADDAYVIDAAGLAEAWALTGLDDDAAPYREGMPFSAQMNARQMEMWLDELLSEEMTALQHMHSQMETALAEMKADQPALYAQMTEGRVISKVDNMLEAADDIYDATRVTDNTIDTYKALRKINKGNGLEVHHIVEKRFAKS